MRISDWSSDLCSSDLATPRPRPRNRPPLHVRNAPVQHQRPYLWIAHRFRPSLGNRNIFVRIAGNSGEAPRFPVIACSHDSVLAGRNEVPPHMTRSEEHTSELQSLMRISYAVICLKN